MFGYRPSGPRIIAIFAVSFLSQLATGKPASPAALDAPFFVIRLRILRQAYN
jgi:hypothetical protein